MKLEDGQRRELIVAAYGKPEFDDLFTEYAVEHLEQMVDSAMGEQPGDVDFDGISESYEGTDLDEGTIFVFAELTRNGNSSLATYSLCTDTADISIESIEDADD